MRGTGSPLIVPEDCRRIYCGLAANSRTIGAGAIRPIHLSAHATLALQGELGHYGEALCAKVSRAESSTYGKA